MFSKLRKFGLILISSTFVLFTHSSRLFLYILRVKIILVYIFKMNLNIHFVIKITNAFNSLTRLFCFVYSFYLFAKLLDRETANALY